MSQEKFIRNASVRIWRAWYLRQEEKKGMSVGRTVQPLPERWQIAIILTGILLLAACTRTASNAPFVYATDTNPRVMIDRVRITEGNGIYISGRSTLESGECIRTNLLENEKEVSWWPRDVCIQADAGQWEMLVSLGRNNRPEKLDPGASYEVRAWWDKQPNETVTRFPFDLNGPKKP